MALTLADIYDLKKGFKTSIHVGNIPYEVSKALKLKNSNVYLSPNGYRHIMRKHPDLNDFHLLHFPFALAKGLLFRELEHPEFVICSYQDYQTGKRFFAAVEMTDERTAVWTRGFYKARKRQTKAKLKRPHEILKTHD